MTTIDTKPTPMPIDYIIREVSRPANWPGLLPYRGDSAPLGRGYRTADAAEDRVRRILTHYAGLTGTGPTLSVIPRYRTDDRS